MNDSAFGVDGDDISTKVMEILGRNDDEVSSRTIASELGIDNDRCTTLLLSLTNSGKAVQVGRDAWTTVGHKCLLRKMDAIVSFVTSRDAVDVNHLKSTFNFPDKRTTGFVMDLLVDRGDLVKNGDRYFVPTPISTNTLASGEDMSDMSSLASFSDNELIAELIDRRLGRFQMPPAPMTKGGELSWEEVKEITRYHEMVSRAQDEHNTKRSNLVDTVDQVFSDLG